MAEDKNVNINLSVGSGVVENILENLVDKPSKSIGETFNDIWYLVLGGPVGQLAEKRRMKYADDLKKYKNRIEEEIEKIPIQDRTEADIQIIGHILEVSKYCAEKEQIRDMFAKLIASSMDKNRKEYVRPLYVDIISKMTVNDAKLFAGCFSRIEEDIMTDEEFYISLESLMHFGLLKNSNDDSSLYDGEVLGDGREFDNGVKILPIKMRQIIVCKVSEEKEKMYMVTALGMDLKKICL